MDKYLNKIHNCDCLEFMKGLPDKSVDLVLTDPPYKIVAGGSGGCFGLEKRGYHQGVKTLSNGFDLVVLDEIKRISKRVNCYLFCSKGQILDILSWLAKHSVNFDLLCYHKTNPTPMCNNKYLSDTEYIIYMREAGVGLSGSYKTKKKYFLQENAKTDIPHPTVKPLNIIKTLIKNSSQENDIIFDPFMGSGTTAVAAYQMGRRWFGCEISEQYVEIARKRIADEKNNLFEVSK
jgi:DNA modification methylase